MDEGTTEVLELLLEEGERDSLSLSVDESAETVSVALIETELDALSLALTERVNEEPLAPTERVNE